MDLLPPGDMPGPNAAGDDVRDFPDQWASDMWPSLWPRVIHRYATTAARDADLAGLGTGDIAFAWVDASRELTYWSGTAWLTYRETFRSGDTTAIYGTAPSVTTPKVRQEFTFVYTTGAAGGVIVDFPTPFLHGITFISATPGAETSDLGFLVCRGGTDGMDLTQAQFTARKPDGSLLIDAIIRLSVVAVGW